MNWSEEQCFELNASQHDHKRHPYTCGNDSNHRPLIATPHEIREDQMEVARYRR
jgi:hypothetical protein